MIKMLSLRTIVLVFAAITGLAVAFKAPQQSGAVSRRDVINKVGVSTVGAFIAQTTLVVADDEAPAAPVAPKKEKVDLGPAPDAASYKLKYEYYADAAQMVKNMRYATFMDKSTPDFEKIAISTKKQMIDFISYYRRFPNVSGKMSYSTLYTSVNVLAGHYASYGTKFPVPEKRRKRLAQEYAEIEKNLKKQR
mmetsp:Transcript_26619/g.42045  ORF Transcript_26619/g.42045 Transcript_26619/m.42045 type:complete len:193 (-) Transcript_26619:504-1082(-)